MSQNSGTLKISEADMQLFMCTMETMMAEQLEQLAKHFERFEAKQSEQFDKHFERMSKKIDKHFGEVRESLGTVRENLRESLQITQESNPGEKKEVEDVEEQAKTGDNHQVETSISVPEEVPVPEIQEKGVTLEISAVGISERQGECATPNEQDVGEREMVKTKLKSGSRQTNQTKLKEKRRHKRSLAAAGAHRKKSKLSKKKWELRKKTTRGKSQQWIDQVRKKHREQMNHEQRQTTRQQRHVPWDPGGLVYKLRTSSTVPDYRSQDNTFVTSTPIEATNKDPLRD
jgi:hypothetical protein